MDIAERASQLAADLDADEEEVQRSLENLVEYDVPMEEAVQSVRRRYGGESSDSGGPTPVDIADIDTDSGNVTVTGVVLSVGKRPIQYQGEERVILEGEIADESGRISYTAWEEFDITPGDTVRIGNAGVREWEGHPELNFGERSTVEIIDEELEIEYDIGGQAELSELAPGDRGRTVVVRVLEAESRTIDGRDGPTEITSGVVADETARLPFTDWAPREEVAEGESIRIENAYVREFRGVPSLNLSRFSRVSTAERTVDPGGPTALSIREAVARGGVYDVSLTGALIEIRENSGLIQRCPECNRLTQSGECRTHGSVDPVDDLRIKAILDDGTGTVTAVIGTELTEEIYGGDVEDARAEAREAMDQTAVADTIAESIVGREVRLRGHLSVDEYGATLEVTEFDEPSNSPTEEAAAFLSAVEGAAQ